MSLHGTGPVAPPLEDYPPDKAQYLLRTPNYCRQLAAHIGRPPCRSSKHCWANGRWIVCAPSRAFYGLKRPSDGNAWKPPAHELSTMAMCAIGASRISSTLRLDREPLPAAPPPTEQPVFAFARSAPNSCGGGGMMTHPLLPNCPTQAGRYGPDSRCACHAGHPAAVDGRSSSWPCSWTMNWSAADSNAWRTAWLSPAATSRNLGPL